MKTIIPVLTILLIQTLSLQAETYRYVDKALVVRSLLEKVDKDAVIIGEDAYLKSGKGLFDVTMPEGADAPDVVYLKKTIEWLHQSPAPESATSESNTGTLTLTAKSDQGQVQINNGSGWQELTTLTIASGVQVRTTGGAFASFAAPGIDALHLDQESEIKFTQEKSPTGISSTIDLSKGTSFIRTQKLDSVQHDFKIASPVSIAAARGTEYLLSHQNGVSVTCIVQGGVDVKRADGNPVAELNVDQPGDLLFQAVPELSAKQYSEWLYNMVVRIGTKNKEGTTARTFTGYLPVVRKDSHLKSFWEAIEGGRIKW